MTKKIIFYILTIVIIIIGIQSCMTYYFRSNYRDANSLIHEAKNIKTKLFLKAHMKNGDVYILKGSWKIDTISNIVSGNGTKYNFNRRLISQGAINIQIDSVAIFETNKKIQNPEARRITALTQLEHNILNLLKVNQLPQWYNTYFLLGLWKSLILQRV